MLKKPLDVPFLPWVGRNYRSGTTRLLVLGESHYDEDHEFDGGRPHQDFTRVQIDKYLEVPSWKFWTNITQVVAGKPKNKCDIEAVWARIAFYNYVNCFVGAGPRIPPMASDWKNSMEDFRKVLADLEPTHILVLGMRLWDHLEADEERGEDIVIGDRKARVWYFDSSIPCLPIFHPSGGFSSSKWAAWVTRLQELPTG